MKLKDQKLVGKEIEFDVINNEIERLNILNSGRIEYILHQKDAHL